MTTQKKSPLIFYLLINILVSAVTTLIVLWIWELANPRPELEGIIEADASAVITDQTELFHQGSENEPAIDDVGSSFENQVNDVHIRLVVGAGNLDVEYVEIINQGDKPVDLTGWQLVNQREQVFTFPTMILNSNGTIIIYSKSGINTVMELFWQSDSPIWQSGETVWLKNSNSEIITTYSIP